MSEHQWVDLPSASRRGFSKTYNLSEAHGEILARAFQTVQAELTKLMGAKKAIHLVSAVKDGFNFETLDEGFSFEGTPYTILSMSHKGQSAKETSWHSLEPHVAMRGVAFFTSVFFIQKEFDGPMIPNVTTWDTMQSGKVISVTRCHFTPNGRPLGVCRKEDRGVVAAAPATSPNTASTNDTASTNVWDLSAAPAAPAATSVTKW